MEKIFTHEAGWKFVVGADAAIDFDESLHDDLGNLTTRQGIFKLVTEDKHHGQRFTGLVRTGTGTRGENATQLVQHP